MRDCRPAAAGRLLEAPVLFCHCVLTRGASVGASFFDPNQSGVPLQQPNTHSVTGSTFCPTCTTNMPPSSVSGQSFMSYFRFLVAGLLASLIAVATYASIAPAGFGPLAAVPAFFVAIVVLASFAPRLN